MARQVANKIYRDSSKGLITEASELTYPENSSIAEDNCVIFKKGNRTRRLGFDIEVDGSPSSFVGQQDPRWVIKEFRWDSAAKNANKNFVVQQYGNMLYFYDQASNPLSAGLKNFAVDLNLYLAPNRSFTNYTEVEGSTGDGYFFVVGGDIEPLIIEYNEDTDSISIQRIYIQIRDFQGVPDGLANDQEPATLTPQHHYNLRNQGWVSPDNDGTGTNVQYFDGFGNSAIYKGPTSSPITAYFTANNRYPPNNKQWWVARDATTNEFDPALLKTVYSGNMRAPRGHFVVDAFYIDRSAVSGVPGLPVVSTTKRPVSVAFFSGRVWFLSGSNVYFSQLLDDKGKAGFCYQEADPTAEDISDLLPTDGGHIPIPEMADGIKLVPLGDAIVVFGSNGIWSISGTAQGFSASDMSVAKINPVGCNSRGAIVEAENQIYWWSSVGIMAMSPKIGQFGPVEGVFDRVNISEETIQHFYNNNILEDRKQYAKGIYDPGTNTIQWLFSDNPSLPLYGYNRILNLDLNLQAFYPWSLSTAEGYFLTGAVLSTDLQKVDHPQIPESFVKFSFAVPAGSYKSTAWGYFFNNNFADWAHLDGTGVPYLSFVETGYELLDDAMRKKATPWIYTYFRRTEENFEASPTGDFTVDKPSSCLIQVKWNWANSPASGKYSTKFEAYRHTRLPMFTEDDLAFNTGFPLVQTKHKVRGQGRAIQFRLESDKIGHDFDLIGWAVSYTGTVVI